MPSVQVDQKQAAYPEDQREASDQEHAVGTVDGSECPRFFVESARQIPVSDGTNQMMAITSKTTA
jgi:hypothetical protein